MGEGSDKTRKSRFLSGNGCCLTEYSYIAMFNVYCNVDKCKSNMLCGSSQMYDISVVISFLRKVRKHLELQEKFIQILKKVL